VRRFVTPGLIALAALAALAIPERAAVVSALTGEPLQGVGLEHSWSYLLLAPALGIFDFLTVLTVDQHVTVLFSVVVLYVLWRVARPRTRRSLPVRALVEAGATVAFVLALAGFYATGVLAYRPMARLVVDDPDVVVVDFHSHTRASHDGRWDFSTERNRAWHRGAGFHVAYIADHDSVGPALRGLARNPERAGEGTVVLVGREVVYAGQHVAVLGTVDPREGDGAWRPDPAAPDARWCEGWPVLIQTIPNDLGRVPVPVCTGRGGGVEAIELLDGDPRGLAQSDREWAHIMRLADSLDVALVSSSNLHGWGSTAVSWNLVRIPGWRDMTPEEVGDRIEHMIRHERREALDVVTYRRPGPAGEGRMAAVGSSFALPTHFVTLRTRPERLAWLAWITLTIVAGRALARRRDGAGGI